MKIRVCMATFVAFTLAIANSNAADLPITIKILDGDERSTPRVNIAKPVRNPAIVVAPMPQSKNEWRIAYKIEESEPINILEIGVKSNSSSNKSIYLLIPSMILIDAPVVYFRQIVYNKQDFSESFIRQKIWGGMDPKSTTPLSELFDGLQLTNEVLESIPSPNSEQFKHVVSARVALVYMRIVSILRERHWIEPGESFDKSSEIAIQILKSGINKTEVVEGLKVKRKDLQERITQFESGKYTKTNKIHQALSKSKCTFSKLKSLKQLTIYASEQHNTENREHGMHPWKIAAEMAQCAVQITTCPSAEPPSTFGNTQTSESNAQVLGDVVETLKFVAKRVSSASNSPPKDIGITLKETEEKLNAIETGEKVYCSKST